MAESAAPGGRPAVLAEDLVSPLVDLFDHARAMYDRYVEIVDPKHSGKFDRSQFLAAFADREATHHRLAFGKSVESIEPLLPRLPSTVFAAMVEVGLIYRATRQNAVSMPDQVSVVLEKRLGAPAARGRLAVQATRAKNFDVSAWAVDSTIPLTAVADVFESQRAALKNGAESVAPPDVQPLENPVETAQLHLAGVQAKRHHERMLRAGFTEQEIGPPGVPRSFFVSVDDPKWAALKAIDADALSDETAMMETLRYYQERLFAEKSTVPDDVAKRKRIDADRLAIEAENIAAERRRDRLGNAVRRLSTVWFEHFQTKEPQEVSANDIAAVADSLVSIGQLMRDDGWMPDWQVVVNWDDTDLGGEVKLARQLSIGMIQAAINNDRLTLTNRLNEADESGQRYWRVKMGRWIDDRLWSELQTVGRGMPLAAVTSEAVAATEVSNVKTRIAISKLPAGDLGDAWLSPRDIQKRVSGHSVDAITKRLNRWRKKNLDGWKEVKERRANEAAYLYRFGAVRHLFEASNSASNERPTQ